MSSSIADKDATEKFTEEALFRGTDTYGFGTQDYLDMYHPIRDPLVHIRSPEALSPADLREGLRKQGFIRLKEKLCYTHLAIEPEEGWERWAAAAFPEWPFEDHARFAEARRDMHAEDARVQVYRGDAVDPGNSFSSREVVVLTAGGQKEGLLSARGAMQIHHALQVAQEKGLPLIFFNGVTSADPSFASEVNGISRIISHTMAAGLNLTIPKITVIVGEAASAGAHAGWQLADETLAFSNGSMLTVIRPEEALKLLKYHEDVAVEAGRIFSELYGMYSHRQELSRLLRAADTAETLLRGGTKERGSLLAGRDELKALVEVAEAFTTGPLKKTMIIMPADNPRFLSAMLTRGADMITLQVDGWQKKAEHDPLLTKEALLRQIHHSLREAQKKDGARPAAIFFRLCVDHFSGFWTPDDIKQIVKTLEPVGLTGIRLTNAASKEDLITLTTILREVEQDVRIAQGHVKICLSVESNEAISQLREVVLTADEDKRVRAIVFGVRDYTKAAEGVSDRDFSHPKVLEAKTRLSEAKSSLVQQGWDIVLFHSVTVEPTNDALAIEETRQAVLFPGVDGMLVVTPNQLPPVKAAFLGMFQENGAVHEGFFRELENKIASRVAELLPGVTFRTALSHYHKLVYQLAHDAKVKYVQAGLGLPRDLQRIGIIDALLPGEERGVAAVGYALWSFLQDANTKDALSMRQKRLEKLARLGAMTVQKAPGIEDLQRREKARGRGQKAAQFWVDLLTEGKGFKEEILTDLEPSCPIDILEKMGRKHSYACQIKEAQGMTGTLTGIIAGYIAFGERDVLLLVRDQDFINATAGAATGEIIRRACLDVTKRVHDNKVRNPAIVYIDVSAGGRVQEGAFALAPSELALTGLIEARKAGVAIITIGHTNVLGSDTIGPFYHADKSALIGDTEVGLAGRRIVQRASHQGKDFPPGFRFARYHQKMGTFDYIPAPEGLHAYLRTALSTEREIC